MNATAAISSHEQFISLIDANRQLISKVCYMYATDAEHFRDLYQEVVANLWQGRNSFRGDAQLSTWIYRVAINTCVTYYRRNRRHSQGAVSLDNVIDLPADDTDRAGQLREMYRLISSLAPMEKALIMMWLDECSYEEISAVTGLARNNVASRLRRIKLKLIEMGR